MREQIIKLAQELQDELINLRRDFHRYPEVGWTEFRTASIVAKHLEDYGYKVLLGEEVIDVDAMMGVPTADVLSKHLDRAKAQGAAIEYLDKMQGGKTGVMAILKTDKPGPVTALRFDIDANDMNEATEASHRPVKEGFSSVNEGAMHACGHDGHAAIGLGVAKLLMEIREELTGTIKLIFQPAEEGVRGGASMVAKGIVDDVDYMIGSHIGFGATETGKLICGGNGFLATTKLDATFTGIPAHAGAKPEEGKSALLAAASATMNMQGIYRHSSGASRINIGVLQAGSGRNVVPDHALLKLETRGVTSEVNEFMKQEAIRMIKASAMTYDVNYEIKEMGGAMSGESDQEMVTLTREVAEDLNIFNEIKDYGDLGGSEDYTYFMNRVQKNGGKSNYVMIGTKIAAGHHDSFFDFDELVLSKGVALLVSMATQLNT